MFSFDCQWVYNTLISHNYFNRSIKNYNYLVIFMDKNKIIIGVLIVLILALSISAASAFSLFGKQDVKLVISSEDTLNQGDNLTVNLTNANKKPIDNATVNVTIIAENGTNQTHSIVTNEKGVGSLKLDNDVGSYVVNCTYGGNDDYNGNATSQNLTINEVAVDDSSLDDGQDDPGAFYSEQEGRVIYTGEIVVGPDGNTYKHLGYNEWEQID